MKGYYATEVKSLIKSGGERNNWLSSLSIGTNLRLSQLVEARRKLSKYLAHSFELRKSIYVKYGQRNMHACFRVNRVLIAKNIPLGRAPVESKAVNARVFLQRF